MALVDGSASWTTSALAVGDHRIIAVYGGDPDFAGSISRVIHQRVGRDATTVALASSVNPSAYGQTVTFTATVTADAPGGGTPTGDVTFYDGSTDLGTVAMKSGVATLSTSNLSVGVHRIHAVYDGDADFATSQVVLRQVDHTIGGSPTPGAASTIDDAIAAVVDDPTDGPLMDDWAMATASRGRRSPSEGVDR